MGLGWWGGGLRAYRNAGLAPRGVFWQSEVAGADIVVGQGRACYRRQRVGALHVVIRQRAYGTLQRHV